jgi:dTMP kinase
LTYEPTDGPVGKLIRDSLSGRITAHDSGERIRFSEGALSLLFAADRIEHSREIERLRRAGDHVVSDRYVHSSIAYQSTSADITPARVVEVNRGVAVPDITLFLDVPVDECLRRLGGRSDSPTIYERKELLDRIDENYRRTRRLYERHYGRIVTIDGTPAADEVFEAIVAAIADVIGFAP